MVPALAGPEPNSAVACAAQSTLSVPPHGIAAAPPDRGTLHLLIPPPSAAHGNGRHWACLAREFSACFRCRRISPPALSTTGPLTNQAYMSKREAHGEGEAYPRYPPLARPDDAEKREPIPWVRLPQARSGPWRRTPCRRGREWMKSFPWPARSLNSSLRARGSGAFHLRCFRG